MSRNVSVATLAAEYRIGNVNGTENMWEILGQQPDLTKWNDLLTPGQEAEYRAVLEEYVTGRAQRRGELW